MKYLGIDLGLKYVGLAVSDEAGILSFPYKTITYNDINILIEDIKQIIYDENIDEIVLGLPYNMDGSEGEAYDRSISFKKLLNNEQNIKINLMDERLSSVSAENILLETNIRRDKRKQEIDKIAASIILEAYLRKVNK